MKVYISGKISGLPWGQVVIKFLRAEIMIRDIGHEPINPLRLNPKDVTWEDAMKVDLKALDECDAILMLTDWSHSKGAIIELDYAFKAFLDIWDYQIIKKTWDALWIVKKNRKCPATT